MCFQTQVIIYMTLTYTISSSDAFHNCAKPTITKRIVLHKETVLGNIKETKVDLQRSDISSIAPDAFRDMINLTSVNLEVNSIKVLKADMFKDLKSLKVMNFNRNQIRFIQNGTFMHLISLGVLNLAKNCIVKLNGDSFLGLISLQNLDLLQNRLDKIKDETFKHLMLLENLNLRQNNIAELASNSFFGLRFLKHLNLKFNSIMKLEESTFKHLVSLEHLYLGENALADLNESFIGLKSLKHLDLGYNCIKKRPLCMSKIRNRTFEYQVSLKELYMSSSKLEKLERDAFVGLTSLTHLNLAYNLLENLNKAIFIDLKSLKYLDLENNKLQNLFPKTFQYLTSLETVDLTSNNVVEIDSLPFPDAMLLKIDMTENHLVNCTFLHVKHVNILILEENKLTLIHKDMFVGLRNVTTLDLCSNRIDNIHKEAFHSLVTLKTLKLCHNKLTNLSNELFAGLHSLENLDLDSNAIHHIGKKEFVEVLPVQNKLTINLRKNKVSLLRWTAFVNFPSNTSQRALSAASFKSVTINLERSNFKCGRTLCWLKHLQWKNVVTYYIYEHWMFARKNLRQMCSEKLRLLCPTKEIWCMKEDNDTCETQCRHFGEEGGKLVIDGDVCPFQHFCKCTCPLCVEECASQGMVHIHNETNMFLCSVCNCECDKNLNCWKLCDGSNFLMKNNTFGCLECKCLCPDVNCDSKCNGRGLGLVKVNKNNCTVCAGCTRKGVKGNRKTIRNVLISSLLSISALCFLTICVIFQYKSI